ncbi:MAG: hypothetical protein KC910_20310 [Candidatus Eremiobacteraeota bacterium]|nr:hypothetical protein [Candidatus Eremiobacteraeota bacterium]
MDEEPRGKELIHERGTPLPTRIRDGQFEDEHLMLDGLRVPWDDVYFMALGIIDQVVKDNDGPKGVFRKMMGKARGSDDESKSSNRGRHVSEVYILDLFVDGYEQAFRFDSAAINYRQFLDEVGYISMQNFFKFCVHLARRTTRARFDASLVGFLGRRRELVRHFDAIYDFELEVQNFIDRMDDQTEQKDVDLSRDSWMDEWSDW